MSHGDKYRADRFKAPLGTLHAYCNSMKPNMHTVNISVYLTDKGTGTERLLTSSRSQAVKLMEPGFY